MKFIKIIGLTMASASVVLLAAGGAHAQSSITLFGTVDAGLQFTNKTVNSATGKNGGQQFSLISSGQDTSVFGLKGQEDLGGGLVVKFHLESGISVVNGGFDNDNGGLFGRDAWVSLGGKLGEIRIGLQYSPYVFALFESDPRSFDQFGSAATVVAFNSATGFYTQNAVQYTSPKIAGFTGVILMALGGVAGDFKAGREISGSLTYENGGLFLNAAFMNSPINDNVAITSDIFTAPLNARTLGAAYNFSVITVKAAFVNYNAPELFNNGIRTGGDNNVYSVGFTYHVLPGLLDVSSGAWVIKDQHDSRSHALVASLGTEYFLSRRTSLYANVGIANNHGNENAGLSLEGDVNSVLGTTIGADVGIVHRF